jgi:hypothetical protein
LFVLKFNLNKNCGLPSNKDVVDRLSVERVDLVRRVRRQSLKKKFLDFGGA